MLTKIIAYIVFVIIWVSLAGFHVEPLLILYMLGASLLTLLISIRLDLLPKKNHFKLSAIMYFVWLLKEIFMSSIAVVRISWRRNLKIQPLLEPIKTTQINNVGIATYANSITLTPGTVTLSAEGDHLLIHALDISFMDDLKSGEMDSKVKEVIK
jgi:multicomponent Na+:H+ antiporter subunit E